MGDPFQVFVAGQATSLTEELDDASKVGNAVLQFVTTGFSGTLDFQGKPHAGGEWVNLPYVTLGGAVAPSTAQVSLSVSTATLTYVVAAMAQMRVVMTRSAGSIAGYGQYRDEWPMETQGVSLATALSSTIDSVDIPKLAAAVAASDALSNPTTAPTLGYGLEWNGSTWQRRRGGEPVTVLASAARTATNNSSDITVYNGRGLVVFVDITAYTAGGLTAKIQAKDPVSLKYVDVLTSASLAATGTTRLVVYPGVTAAANLAVSDVLSRAMRVRVEHADATSITYSVGAVVLP